MVVVNVHDTRSLWFLSHVSHSPGHLYLHMIHKRQLNLVQSFNPVTMPAERHSTATTSMKLLTCQFPYLLL